MPKNRSTEENREYMKWYREQQLKLKPPTEKRHKPRSIKRWMPTTLHRLYREIGIILPRVRR